MTLSTQVGQEITPYRSETKHRSDKIILLSMEGSVTEEEYIRFLKKTFPLVKTQIQYISVREDILAIPESKRSKEQRDALTKSKPYQLVSLMDDYIEANKDLLEREMYPDDECWIVFDVDDNLTGENKEQFDCVLEDCKRKGYRHAISNPFFELWLLLHYDKVSKDDEQYAVTESHPYEKTDYFRRRLEALGHSMRNKHVRGVNINEEYIRQAVQNGRALWNQNKDQFPYGLYTEMYKLVEEIVLLEDKRKFSGSRFF